jgi:SAM-dependent methyltransferase
MEQPLRRHYTPLDEPSKWVRRFADLVPVGRPVLDIACGGGRRSLVFLDRGHPVTAIDQDVEQCEIPGDRDGFTLISADLEDGSKWPFLGQRFGGVVVANYLHRPLLPALMDALEPGGVLIYETYAMGNENFGRPRNPHHLLNAGELLEVVRGRMWVTAYEDFERPEPKPARIQRICAVLRSP